MKNNDSGLDLFGVVVHFNALPCTSSSAVEQPVYTRSVGGSIPSSCTIHFLG